MNMTNALRTQTAAKPNGLVARSGILQRKCNCGNQTAIGDECEECKMAGLQRTLGIGSSDDPLEREADRVADEVMAMTPNSSVSRVPPRIQRLTAPSSRDARTVPASVERLLASPGQPLDFELREEMGQLFGHDFSNVRIHSDSAANQIAYALNAKAFTLGTSIAFQSRFFSPEREAGRHLIAHELAHVIQHHNWQSQSTAMTNTSASEADANSAADAVTHGASYVVHAAAPPNLPACQAEIVEAAGEPSRPTMKEMASYLANLAEVTFQNLHTKAIPEQKLLAELIDTIESRILPIDNSAGEAFRRIYKKQFHIDPIEDFAKYVGGESIASVSKLRALLGESPHLVHITNQISRKELQAKGWVLHTEPANYDAINGRFIGPERWLSPDNPYVEAYRLDHASDKRDSSGDEPKGPTCLQEHPDLDAARAWASYFEKEYQSLKTTNPRTSNHDELVIGLVHRVESVLLYEVPIWQDTEKTLCKPDDMEVQIARIEQILEPDQPESAQ